LAPTTGVGFMSLNTGDSAWLLTATALVLFMTLPGLALFYAGLVRSKNVLSLLMQCFAITGVCSLLWFACGYSIAFGDGGAANNWWGGFGKAFLLGVGRDSLTGSIPEALFFMFQLTFAVITPALVIGAFAERMRFATVLWFSAAWLLLVYAPVTHWVWGGGWLAKLGVMDFAGGIVVHVNAGVAALVCALVLGRRRGFPQVAMPPHSLPITACGAGMLWVGWFGFNAGSALAANGSAAMAMLATHLGASAGALAWMFVEWRRYGKPSMLGIMTGMVAGLGTITPASGFVGPAGAGRGVFHRHADTQAQPEHRRFTRRVTGAWCWRRGWQPADRRVRRGVAGRRGIQRRGARHRAAGWRAGAGHRRNDPVVRRRDLVAAEAVAGDPGPARQRRAGVRRPRSRFARRAWLHRLDTSAIYSAIDRIRIIRQRQRRCSAPLLCCSWQYSPHLLDSGPCVFSAQSRYCSIAVVNSIG
jgi:hypothetical protein